MPSMTVSRSAVNDSATSVTVVAANTERRALAIFNNSSSSLYLAAGSTAATVASFTVCIDPYGYWEEPQPPAGYEAYTGAYTGIWSANSTGAALVTEYVYQ